MILNYFKKVITFIRLYFLLINSMVKKECYFGPFVGEFGHLLSHVVPFISFLHSKGIKVNYCGPEIHKVFFYDDKKNLIVKNFYGIRDFYNEVKPFCNDQIYPEDVKLIINNFIDKAKKSNLPFWDIRKRFFYLTCFCRWKYINGFVKLYPKKKLDRKEFVISLFPSKKKKKQDF